MYDCASVGAEDAEESGGGGGAGPDGGGGDARGMIFYFGGDCRLDSWHWSEG